MGESSDHMSRGGFLPIREVLAIVSLAIILNLVVWYLAGKDQNAYLQVDSFDYLHLGGQIFNEGIFSSLFRTPVFPAFVGFFNAFLGLSVEQFILVQIGLSIINIVLLGRLASFFVSAKWQKIIMLIFAIDLVTIQVSNWVLSETLFSFLLLVSLNLFLTIKIKGNHHYLLVIACGVCFGLFGLCRPVGQFLTLLFAAWLFFQSNNHIDKKKRLVSALIIVLAHMAIFSAWKYHNLQKTGHYFVSTTMSYNIYNWRAAWNIAYRDGRTFEAVKNELFAERASFKQQNKHLSEYEVSQEMTRRGLDIILSTPKETVAQAVRGLVYLYAGIYNGSLERIFQESISLKLAQSYSLLYWGMIYLGILLLLINYKKLTVEEKELFWLCSLIVCYFTFFSIGVESYARLRAPFAPYLIICAVMGWRFVRHSTFLLKVSRQSD